MASDEAKVLLAHQELKKKEKSVSIGKSLGRTFSKTGMYHIIAPNLTIIYVVFHGRKQKEQRRY